MVEDQQKRINITEYVLSEMKNYIINGEWKPGNKIPSEAQLVKHFGVSRISIREAVSRLVGMGILSVHRGDGTYVTEIIPSEYVKSLLPLLMLEQTSVNEILEFRLMLEPSYIPFVLERITDSEIDMLQVTLVNMIEAKEQQDPKRFSRYDLRFHLYIATAVKNTVMVKVYGIINDMLKNAMRDTVKIIGFDDGIMYHTLILNAIKDKNTSVATDLMRAHLSNTLFKMNSTIQDVSASVNEASIKSIADR